MRAWRAWLPGGRVSFTSHLEHRDARTHVLEIEAAEGADEHPWLVLDVVEDLPGKKDFPRRAKAVDSGGYVDAVSIDSLVFSHDVTT